MAIFNKDTALEIAYVGAGAVAGKVASSQVYGMLPDTIKSKVPAQAEPFVKGGIPVAIGLFLPRFAGSSALVRGLANGMIASGASTIVGDLLETAGVDLPMGNVMMGNTMMQGAGVMTYDASPQIGGTDGDSNYNATSYDFTSADAGEMDF